MRTRELRLRRSFRCIVASMLAAPLAGAVACHVSAAAVSDDASITGAEDAGEADASGGDATLPAVDGSVAPDASTWDPEACAAVTIDGAYIDDNPDGCSTFRALPCGLPPDPLKDASQVEGCLVYLGTCAGLCGQGTLFCQLAPVSCDTTGTILDAAMVIDCVGACGIAGRAPIGLRRPLGERGASAGDYFATMAHLESASVRAFRDLEQWLVALGAPARLSRAARRAAADERRHARATARLARRFGGTPARPRVASVPAPSLVALLEDDAVAGCVGETFAALLATWQAAHASDARIRRTMGRIADEETRHAALAWEILHWGLPRLTSADRARVGRALDGALTRAARTGASVGAEARILAGHPSPRDQQRLAREVAPVVRREANLGA